MKMNPKTFKILLDIARNEKRMTAKLNVTYLNIISKLHHAMKTTHKLFLVLDSPFNVSQNIVLVENVLTLVQTPYYKRKGECTLF